MNLEVVSRPGSAERPRSAQLRSYCPASAAILPGGCERPAHDKTSGDDIIVLGSAERPRSAHNVGRR